MNKVLIQVYVPVLEEKYEVFIPINRRLYKVMDIITETVRELSGGYFEPSETNQLYDKDTGQLYDLNILVKHSGIKNGSRVIII